MTKWNAQNQAGGIVNVQDLETNQPINAFEQEFNNNKGVIPNSQDRSAICHSGKFRAVCCCFLLVVAAAIVIGVLYPRFPTLYVNRTESAKSLGLDRRAGINTIFGNMSVVFENPNPYEIDIEGVEMEITVGTQSATQVKFNATLGQFNIPGSQASSQVIPIAVPIPANVNAVALGVDIAADCLRDNLMSSKVRGVAQVKALGMAMDYNFGPMDVESACIEFN